MSSTGVLTPLVDGYGRVHRDLRISVTDRCNFRCTYCMPAEGMVWQPRDHLLSFEEIERVARVAVERFGFDSIRLTGGEPTVRARLPLLVERLAPLGVDLSLTTNGSLLGAMAHDLAAAGLDRVNVSLDSLRPERFAALTRRDDLPRVLQGIRAAVAAGLAPVKVNVVVVRGSNDDEVVDFARFGRDEGVRVRFIEFMPLDADHHWDRSAVVPSAEIVAAIGAEFPLQRLTRDHDPAQRHRYLDGGGEIGVIGSVTEPFCASCDRVRLTADGQLRACLFATDETDLRALLRGGADDDGLAAALEATVGSKWAGHGISDVHFIRPSRSMSEIGG
ncbi:GTP 3',8-cyclase MoaA [Aquihabitans sp. G128]|uniref:GTP 3',8-cyclase MoaA n=1 Tax=Aquihabitans sp. G128 TaxID=2849779 RepID=UPI001C24B86F|nr:GTP 3',8-cyclase MoaA [Aquihabitans sp. G128]QXC63261.1 GTP 3',8-cyclase MoaA [Aquihabitans sp. G128]